MELFHLGIHPSLTHPSLTIIHATSDELVVSVIVRSAVFIEGVHRHVRVGPAQHRALSRAEELVLGYVDVVGVVDSADGLAANVVVRATV